MASILHVTQLPDNGWMRVKFHWDAIDPTDLLLANKLGEPRVATGGVFVDPSDSSFTWTEPDGYVFLFTFAPAFESRKMSDFEAQKIRDSRPDQHLNFANPPVLQPMPRRGAQPYLENGYDSTKDPLAQKRATVWAAVMQTRLNAALVALRTAGDTFSLDTTVTI